MAKFFNHSKLGTVRSNVSNKLALVISPSHPSQDVHPNRKANSHCLSSILVPGWSQITDELKPPSQRSKLLLNMGVDDPPRPSPQFRCVLCCFITFLAGLLLSPNDLANKSQPWATVDVTAKKTPYVVTTTESAWQWHVDTSALDVDDNNEFDDDNVDADIDDDDETDTNDDPEPTETDANDSTSLDNTSLDADDDAIASLQPINYLRQPEAFLEVFRDCEADPDCHVTYHHVSKTGGACVWCQKDAGFMLLFASHCLIFKLAILTLPQALR